MQKPETMLIRCVCPWYSSCVLLTVVMQHVYTKEWPQMQAVAGSNSRYFECGPPPPPLHTRKQTKKKCKEHKEKAENSIGRADGSGNSWGTLKRLSKDRTTWRSFVTALNVDRR